jgi:hypothetical protein
MDRAHRIAWVERLVWVLIFGGLATLVLGLATRDFDSAIAWALIVGGSVLAAGGVVLIWVRSRLDDDMAP